MMSHQQINLVYDDNNRQQQQQQSMRGSRKLLSAALSAVVLTAAISLSATGTSNSALSSSSALIASASASAVPPTGGPPRSNNNNIKAMSAQLHPLKPRLVAIGDVHGDIDNFKAILLHAQLIDCDGNWVGEDATVVQLGDVCDRGPHSHSIIEYIDDTLIPQAKKAGGEFVQMLGNHELLTMRGDHRFTLPEHINLFGGVANWTHHFSTNGVYGKRNSELPAIITRNGTAFVHAGLLPDHAEKGIDWVNAEMREMMAANNWDHPFSSVTSPVWTREQVYAAMRKGECGLLKEALRRLSESEVREGRLPVNRLVVGHTIQPNGAVSVFCDGAFIATDISSSQYMPGGGHLAFVEFRRRVYVSADPAAPGIVDRFAANFTKQGRLAGHEGPLNDQEQLYLQILNEKGSGGKLEIVGVPTYPPIPWKRHPERGIMMPKWVTVAAAANNAESGEVGHGALQGNSKRKQMKGQQRQGDGNNNEETANGEGGEQQQHNILIDPHGGGAEVMNVPPAAGSGGSDGGAKEDNGRSRKNKLIKDTKKKFERLEPLQIVGILSVIVLIALIVSGKGGHTVRTWFRRRNKSYKDTV